MRLSGSGAAAVLLLALHVEVPGLEQQRGQRRAARRQVVQEVREPHPLAQEDGQEDVAEYQLWLEYGRGLGPVRLRSRWQGR